jgi:hypothetical protein
VGDGGRELAGLGQTGTEQTRDLLDQSLGSEERVVLLGELLDELLVLVEPGGEKAGRRSGKETVRGRRTTCGNGRLKRTSSSPRRSELVT